MPKQRFERFARVFKNTKLVPPEAIINAHSTAIEQHDTDVERLTKSEGRHRRRMEGLWNKLEQLASLNGYWWDEKAGLWFVGPCRLAPHKPKPEPVVVEGVVAGNYIADGRGHLGAIGGVRHYIRVKDGDRVRLTIERIDDDDA